EQSRHAQAVFWTRMAEDGLLDPGVDLDWLIDTTSILGGAETYLLITRMLGWDLDAYENWLVTTSTQLSALAWRPGAPLGASLRSRRGAGWGFGGGATMADAARNAPASPDPPGGTGPGRGLQRYPHRDDHRRGDTSPRAVRRAARGDGAHIRLRVCRPRNAAP